MLLKMGQERIFGFGRKSSGNWDKHSLKERDQLVQSNSSSLPWTVGERPSTYYGACYLLFFNVPLK